ncbi:MAG: hypothetical protein WBM24_03210 [Candidatus Sulfotelmatobacter sp.]
MTETKSAAPAVFADVTKKPKKTRKRTRKNPSTPGHAAAEAEATHRYVPGVCDAGYHEQTPDMGKNLSSGVPTSTSDIGQRYMPDSTYHVHGDGGARGMAASAGNAVSQYNTDRDRNNPGVAAFHNDLRQSSVSFNDVITRLRGVRANPGSTFIGQAGAFANTDAPPGTDGGNPRVALYDPCCEAGSYAGLSHPVAGDAHNRANPTYASARQSATPPGNSHVSSSQANAVSTAVAGKVSNFDVMKACLFPNA